MNPWALSALWVGFSLIATLLAIWSKLLTVLSVIIVGAATETAIRVIHGSVSLRSNRQWIALLVYAWDIALAFFARTELEPLLFKSERNAALPSKSGRFFGHKVSTAIRHLIRRSTSVFTTIGPRAGKAESLCLKLQNYKHLKSWTRAATPHSLSR
ncbi:MAG TPA: hypothetical protein VKX41_16105 [Alloacidobacterium sp.]|nr:hypothetical protein [Alloacidobacterium sp.]